MRFFLKLKTYSNKPTLVNCSNYVGFLVWPVYWPAGGQAALALSRQGT